MSEFEQVYPSLESYWRAVVLFGQNSASYKFALGKSLLELAGREVNAITLEDLAVPYARHITEHLKLADRQGTSGSSRFLAAARQFNAGVLTHDDLLQTTVSLGFNNVLDAFHVVNQGALPVKFFVDERRSGRRIVLTDELLRLKESLQYQNLPLETEARWRLVETAWSLNLSPYLLQVHHDSVQDLLFVQLADRGRVTVTSSRDALNGYQKGKCFYCFADISIAAGDPGLADVDHFFPHTLSRTDGFTILDQIWNLVLACSNCNRGPGGKFARVPQPRYLDRLHKRNNFLIDSHHPLRETLMNQTGVMEEQRRAFLRHQYREAIERLIHQWAPAFEHAPAF